MRVPQLMKASMKKILTTILMLNCISNVFSQYTNNNYDVYSAKDMNIKGKVKNMTERIFYTDASGKAPKNAMKTSWVYEFDERGNLINQHEIEIDDANDYQKFDYEYLNGKLCSYTYDTYWQEKPYKSIFYYSPSSITIKTPKGKILEVHSLSDDKVTEITLYSNEKPSFKKKYDYNTIGQITRQTYQYLPVVPEKKERSYMYEYNKQGDIIKKEEYRETQLTYITTYNYKYDNNMNWTKCTDEFYQPGENKDDTNYKQITRIYEFY